ncbi:cobalamin-binding protein [Candidatus Methylomirabilis lanthanidiphila]|uniref:Cobalamin-binding protein n=1 Tax=Candidatus Methylomirabilis lanthanidiphila TaxID=2211376 RepID=A0A564ZL52_9BACT|nr:B12-binding domain-containing radical SAM protein [Candidatus Methylomirabilis lanthanidiphila]VUZ86051.1 cobalamin-binding protein [Candidatus Methylomirabilis lanthanidiphila]
MNILLLSMPDSFEHMPTVAIRMPNAALTSLAGNIDPHHEVAVADLILVQARVRQTVERLVREINPDVLGLSVMTFQRKTAKRIVDLVRSLRADVRVVVGGYDPSLAPEAYTDPSQGAVDFIVRGEGEITFRELLRAIENQSGYDRISGLSYRSGDRFSHNPDRPISDLESGEVRLPNRDARVLRGYTTLGRQADVIETSRGCTFDCSFCSIIEMRGRNFHTYPLDRVVADIRDACNHGARAIFIVDDNIMLNVRRFEALCRAIIDAGLHTIDYTVQAMTSVIANHGERLAPLMRRAGFRYVFLGVENILDEDLAFLRARSKNTRREDGRKTGNAAIAAINYLHRNKIYVIGGLIIGNPTDTRASLEANLEFARAYVDWPFIQHPTPYPRTPMTQEFRRQGLIVNDRFEEYDGTTAVVQSSHLSAEEIEFVRWQADRWVKLGHLPVAFAHSPLFVLRNWPWMLAHLFRGSTIKSLLGLEDPHQAFVRYRALRQAEREYL